MEELIKAIDWTQVFAFLGTAGTAVMAYLRQQASARAKQRQRENEIKEKALQLEKAKLEKEKKVNELLKDNIYTTKLRTLKQVFDVKSFSRLESMIREGMNGTPFDRFTIMFLMNGKVEFNFMSVIFDQHQNKPMVGLDSPYSKIRIPEDYHEIITSLPQGRGHWIKAPFEEVSTMAEYMRLEEIKQIGWFKIRRIALDDFNDLLVYCSWSTQLDKEVTWRDKRKLELLTTGRIVPVVVALLSVPVGGDAEDLLGAIKTKEG